MSIRDPGSVFRSIRRKITAIRQAEIHQDDVFLVSYPRSGNTWVRFLLANVIRHDTAQPIDFHSVHSVIPDSEIPEHRKLIEALSDPRIIKSHSTYDPRFPRVIYLLRDGRDVMISYYNYQTKQGRFEGSLRDFLLSSRIPYGYWEEHVQSWLDARIRTEMLTVRFEDLLQDTRRELERMVRFIGISTSPVTLEHAVRASSFDQMRRLEEARGRPYGGSAHRFVRRGTAGRGESEFDEECKAIFKARANNLLCELGYVSSADW
jgi:estrone sulfotransferase